MGLNLILSGSSRYTGSPEPREFNPVPDAKNFIIGGSVEYKGHLLVEIKYPDCINYEGNKILLYMNTTLKELKKQKYLDPHFSDKLGYLSPIARFVPTPYGWKLGERMLKQLY